MRVADLTPARGALGRTRTRSPGMVNGMCNGVRPMWATPSPVSATDSISTSTRSGPRESPDVQQLDLKEERRVRRDHSASALGAVSESRRDDQRALAADFHAGDALIPAL